MYVCMYGSDWWGAKQPKKIVSYSQFLLFLFSFFLFIFVVITLHDKTVHKYNTIIKMKQKKDSQHDTGCARWERKREQEEERRY